MADWPLLLDRAKTASARAYAPYSGFAVGAAALVDDGRMVTGCNVENASYGVTLCAECGLVSELVATGGGRLAAFVCVSGSGEAADAVRPVPPAALGARRPDLSVLTPEGELTMADVLPQAFDAKELPGREPV